MKLFIHAKYSLSGVSSRVASIGTTGCTPNKLSEVSSPELDALLQDTSLSITSDLPRCLVGLTFPDSKGDMWRIGRDWSAWADTSPLTGGVWSRLEMTLQPVGGVS